MDRKFIEVIITASDGEIADVKGIAHALEILNVLNLKKAPILEIHTELGTKQLAIGNAPGKDHLF